VDPVPKSEFLILDSLGVVLPVSAFITYDRILSSIMPIQVLWAPKFHNDFWQKNYFSFSKIISKEIIIAS
jgi:hypothetical protein